MKRYENVITWPAPPLPEHGMSRRASSEAVWPPASGDATGAFVVESGTLPAGVSILWPNRLTLEQRSARFGSSVHVVPPVDVALVPRANTFSVPVPQFLTLMGRDPLTAAPAFGDKPSVPKSSEAGVISTHGAEENANRHRAPITRRPSPSGSRCTC